MAFEDDEFELALTTDEAVVLFEMLKRLDLPNRPDLFNHPAEAQVLLGIYGFLEDELMVQFSPNYPAQVHDSRKRVIAAEDAAGDDHADRKDPAEEEDVL